MSEESEKKPKKTAVENAQSNMTGAMAKLESEFAQKKKEIAAIHDAKSKGMSRGDVWRNFPRYTATEFDEIWFGN